MKTQQQTSHRQAAIVCRWSLLISLLMVYLLLRPYSATGTDQRSSDSYPQETKQMTTVECMQCHPAIATLLRTAGAMHGRVECRLCHLQVHTYIPGKTDYNEILPKCDRCHGNPHGEKLIQCSSCHQEAHAPLSIPASRALSQGCDTCHPELDKDIKTFPTKHSDIYCTACHHSRHGYKPECLECHQPHAGRLADAGPLRKRTDALDQCTSCHPPHKALKVAYPDDTQNGTCAYCHHKAEAMLQKRNTKHSALPCIQCHPDQHKTIKRCKECHGQPHPEDMVKKFGSCGGCHGVAHSVVR